MPTGERSVRRGSRTGKQPAGVTRFVLPPEVKSGHRSHLNTDELRAGLLQWPAERIADYLIQVVGWDLDRRNLELAVIAHQEGSEEASDQLRLRSNTSTSSTSSRSAATVNCVPGVAS